MNKVRLLFKSVTEIVGSDEIGLIILVDESEERQLAIPCERNMLYQFGMRIEKSPAIGMLLPEVLWQVINTQTYMRFEILINDLIEGQYRSILYNIDTLEPIQVNVTDALLLAYISQIPVYISESLMKKQSVEYKRNVQGMAIPLNALTDDMLQRALSKAIQDENYELASHLRDEMKRRNLQDS